MKLALLLAYTIALFVVSQWVGLLVLAGLLVAVLAASRLPAGVMVRSLVPFYILMAFALAMNSFSFDPAGLAGTYGVGGVSAGFLEGADPIALAGGLCFLPEGFARSLFYCVRILAMVVGSLVLAYSTPATQLTAALAWAIHPLARMRVPVDDIALTFTLALRFIPLAFGELQQVRLAQMARGARFQVGSLWRRVSAWGPVMVPWFIGLYRRAARLATAMDVRAYGLGPGHTSLRGLRFRPADAAILACGLVFCAAPCFL